MRIDDSRGSREGDEIMSGLRAVLGTAIAGLFALTTWCAVAQAEISSVEFLGERFVKKFADAKNVADQFTEFGLEREPLTDWSKLVVFHYHPQSGRDPKRAAANLAKLAAQRDQHANPELLTNSAKTEAMTHFFISKTDSDVVELNVFRYAQAADGSGLVSAQFAFRFTLGETDADDVKSLRRRAVEEMGRFPMATVSAHFGRTLDWPAP
jgi:hypothetical protein